MFRYFPSQDGPSHLYNSYVFVNYWQVAGFKEAFILQVPTAGNLAGHGLAILLLKVGIPAELCQKLIVTLCIGGLAFAFRYAVMGIKSAHPASALLILPFLYNWPLQMGFWSFNLGIPFLFICVGLFLRHKGRWNVRSTILLFLSAAGLYVCHPIDWAIGAIVITVMALAAAAPFLRGGTGRDKVLRQVLLPIAVFVPFALPNLLFAEQNQSVEWGRFESPLLMVWPVYTLSPLHLFKGDAGPAKVLFIVLVLCTAATLMMRPRKRELARLDVFLLISALLFILGILSPWRIGEGSYIEVRLLLFGFLTWSLWLAGALTQRILAVALPAVVAISFWLLLARIPEWRTYNAFLEVLVKAGQVLEPNTTVCQMDFSDPLQTILPMEHAVDLLFGRRIIDVKDYEAGRRAFWTRFRLGYFFDENFLTLSSKTDFEGALMRFEGRTGRRLDYIVLTDLRSTPGESLRRLLPLLESRYQLISDWKSIVAIYRLRRQ